MEPFFGGEKKISRVIKKYFMQGGIEKIIKEIAKEKYLVCFYSLKEKKTPAGIINFALCRVLKNMNEMI